MTQKTVIISKFDETLDVKSVVSFNCVIANDTEGLVEQEVVIEYDTLSASDKIKIDEALVVLETYIPS